MAPLVSESAQWQTTSCADHRPGPGRQRRTSSGTWRHASRSSAAPRAYRSMRAARSAASYIAPPPGDGKPTSARRRRHRLAGDEVVAELAQEMERPGTLEV